VLQCVDDVAAWNATATERSNWLFFQSFHGKSRQWQVHNGKLRQTSVQRYSQLTSHTDYTTLMNSKEH